MDLGDLDGMVNVDGLRNGDALGNVDGLDDVVNVDGGRSDCCCCCCCWCCCWCCCCSWCGCRTCWFCGTRRRRKIMSFCRSRCLVRNEHFHLLCGRFSLLLLLLLLSLWPAGEDQGEQACEKALLLVLRCWLLRSRSLCSRLYAIGGRRL